MAALPQALGRVLSRLFYAFPRIREVWNSCPESGQPAAAIKTHLAKCIGLIEEERAIAFLTRRRPPPPGRIDLTFLSKLSFMHCHIRLLRLLFGRLFSSGLLTRKATLGSSLGAIGRLSVCACFCI